jgi:demethylmenaquinone methyltransferase/2-methoxy-6-polyprenyl-1,4-benzoquinol methylase
MTNPLPPPEQKATYVRQMFGQIAQRYDLMNRLMTLGRDQSWRRYTVEQALHSLDPAPGAGRTGDGRVLDVATGTGDLALESLRQRPGVRVVGLDFTPEMLLLARHKAELGNTEPGLNVGDALHLPYADGTFDAVVTAFALRNVTDIPAAFSEMARVTRPGGRIGCLEIAKPSAPFFRRLFAVYFYRLVPLVGGLLTGERSAYTYLPHSLTAFLTPDEIVQVMRRSGWRNVSYRRLMLGTVAVHVGDRG